MSYDKMQIDIHEKTHEALKELADERGVSMSDIVRTALGLAGIAHSKEEGEMLALVEEGDIQKKVLIPGVDMWQNMTNGERAEAIEHAFDRVERNSIGDEKIEDVFDDGSRVIRSSEQPGEVHAVSAQNAPLEVIRRAKSSDHGEVWEFSRD